MTPLFITMPVSVLPEKEGKYFTINNNRQEECKFENGKWYGWSEDYGWYSTAVAHWLKPISVERLEEVLLDFNDNRTCGMQLNRAIQEAINKLSK